jgi:hypothetical protein
LPVKRVLPEIRIIGSVIPKNRIPICRIYYQPIGRIEHERKTGIESFTYI